MWNEVLRSLCSKGRFKLVSSPQTKVCPMRLLHTVAGWKQPQEQESSITDFQTTSAGIFAQLQFLQLKCVRAQVGEID